MRAARKLHVCLQEGHACFVRGTLGSGDKGRLAVIRGTNVANHVKVLCQQQQIHHLQKSHWQQS